jgi:hypothetical protein
VAATGARANEKSTQPNSHAAIEGNILAAQYMTANAAGTLKMAPRAATFVPSVIWMGVTMSLSDAGLQCGKTKLLYPDHRLPPWPTEDA